MKIKKLLHEAKTLTPAQIDFLDNACGGDHYTLNPDGTVDVVGDVDVTIPLTGLPVQFNKITGDFTIDYSELQSTDTLKGCPKIITGNFNAWLIRLISLKHGPEEVGGGIDLSGNNLKSLEYFPKIVGNTWTCNINVSMNALTNLIGLPKDVYKLTADDNPLTSLEGVPENLHIGEFISCGLTNLEGIDKLIKTVSGNLTFEKNQFVSNIVGLAMIDVSSSRSSYKFDGLVNQEVSRILSSSKGGRQEMLRIQKELIEAGYEDLAIK